MQERIKPVLAAGRTVLSGRFVSSTLAYQGSAGGLSWEDISAVAKVALDHVWPDLTLILDLPAQAATARLHAPGKGGKAGAMQAGLFQDRIERRTLDYHRRVQEGFMEQSRRFPDTYRIVAAGDCKERIHANILAAIAAFMAEG